MSAELDPIELDCRRLLCPMPVIRVQDQMQTLAIGQQMIVYCTDPGVTSDIPAWCRVHGHEVLAIEKHFPEIVLYLKRAVP